MITHKRQLALILILSFLLRIYLIDSPMVGPYSQREAHFFAEVRNNVREGRILSYPVTDSCFLEENTYLPCEEELGRHHEPFAAMPTWFATILWMLFGGSLWLPRLLSVLMSVISVSLVYFIGKNISGKKLGIYSSFLLSISPIHVYFGRVLQIDTYASFFYILTLYFSTRILVKYNKRDLILFSVFASLMLIEKITFGIFLLPIWFYFRNKNRLDLLLSGFITLAPVFIWGISYMLYSNFFTGFEPIFELTKFAGISFYSGFLAYLFKSFSLPILLLFALGSRAIIKYRKNNRFLFYHLITSLIFIAAIAVETHQYFLIPLIPTVILVSASVMKDRKPISFIILLLTVPVGFALFHSTTPTSGSVGLYFNNISKSDETFAYSGCSESVVWYADRKGFPFPTLEGLRMAEESLNLTYVVICDTREKFRDSPNEYNATTWSYIYENYHIILNGSMEYTIYFVNPQRAEYLIYKRSISLAE